MRCLTKSPDQRFESAREVARAIRQPTTPRRMLVLAGLAALAVVLAPAWLALSNWNGTPGDKLPVANGSTPAPQPIEPLRALAINVQHFARRNQTEAESRGLLGKGSFTARLGDQVTIEAQLSRPAYAYLLALRPDGQVELCFPESETEPPQRTDRPRYPPSALEGRVRYGLSEGVGLWIFAVVASDQPLPPYRDFIARHPPAWTPQSASGQTVWWFDGQWLDPLTAGGSSGRLRSKGETALGAAPAVVGAAQWLRSSADDRTVAAIGFDVTTQP
jgi:hypothetical protein